MAMICALPEEYTNFTSSILLLGTLDKKTLQEAFHAEEMNWQHRAAPIAPSGTDSALFAAPGTNLKT